VPNAFRSHPEIKCIRVGEGTGSHDPRLRIPLENVVGIAAVPPLASQVVWILDDAVICTRVARHPTVEGAGRVLRLAILSATPGKFAELLPHLRPRQNADRPSHRWETAGGTGRQLVFPRAFRRPLKGGRLAAK
jgi:hypothetical protein